MFFNLPFVFYVLIVSDGWKTDAVLKNQSVASQRLHGLHSFLLDTADKVTELEKLCQEQSAMHARWTPKVESEHWAPALSQLSEPAMLHAGKLALPAQPGGTSDSR